MAENKTDAGRKAADIKARKRAEALRENLKRRKLNEKARHERGSEEAGDEQDVERG